MIPILVAAFALLFGVGAVLLVSGLLRGKSGGGKRPKSNEAKLQEANKRLAQNPLDPYGLYSLGEVYFEGESWDRAMKAYETLSDVLARSQVQDIDRFEVLYRCGFSALKLNLTDQAYQAFATARSLEV